MSRVLFWKLLLRLLLAMVPLVALAMLLRPMTPLSLVALAVAWAGLVALWTALALRRILRPLQAAANALVEGQAETPLGIYRDFDGLAHALASASGQVRATLRKAGESRRELEALLDSMQDAVVAVDAAGRIQWTNQRMQNLLLTPWGVPGEPGGASGPVRIGHALVQTIRDPDVLQCVRAALDDQAVSVKRSTSLLPGRIYEVNASPMPGGGAVAVLHDVTRIEEVERTQRDFVANVSHELRTPLTSIAGYVETLLDHERGFSAQGREFLATILKNTNRMNRLTEDLLVMARVEAPMVTVSAGPIPASNLIEDAVAAMSGMVKDSGLVLEIAETTSAEVFADPDAAMQVLGNLIENAIKYGRSGREGGSRIVLGTREISDPWDAVEFRVQDFGPGIASEHLNRIFERFYRVDKVRSVESGGTGLGLSIARHMVHTQGGTIRAESELGVGSTFFFTLPKALYPRG